MTTSKNNGPAKFNYAILKVLDIEEARQFYTTVFNWEMKVYDNGYTECGGLGMVQASQVVNGSMLVFEVDDVAAVSEKIEAAGGEIIQERSLQDWGAYAAEFHDPSGNRLRIYGNE